MNSRRTFVKQSAMAAAAIAVVNPLHAFAAGPSTVYGGQFSNENALTILHTGDLGKQFSAIHDGSAFNGLGGYRGISQSVNAIRQEWKNVLLMDAGGMDTSLYPAAAELGYDVVQLSQNALSGNMTSIRHLPVISNSLSGRIPNAAASRIIQKGKIRVGIVTACTEPGTANAAVQALENAEKLKRTEGCQLVVCISDLGLNKNRRLNDYVLASRSSDIDLIIGSGTGTVLRTPHTGISRSKQEVIINHAGYGGLVIGKIDFQFNEKGEKTSVRLNNLVIGTPQHRWKGLPSAVQQSA
jgi:5'-nucleotidase